MKVGTIDYVMEIRRLNKFGDDRSIRGLPVKYVKYMTFVALFFSNRPGGHTPNQFSRGISQTT